jgi:hypothetical protein
MYSSVIAPAISDTITSIQSTGIEAYQRFMKAFGKLAVPVFLSSLLSSPGHAATLAEFSVTDAQGRYTQAAYIGDGRVSLQNQDDPSGTELLYDSRKDNVFLIEHADRTYSELDRATVEGLAEQAAGVRETISGNTTPEQQQQIAGMLESIGLQGLVQPADQSRSRVVRTSEMRNVSGHACNVVRVFRNDQLNTVMCVASRGALKLPDADYQVLESMLSFGSYVAGHASDILGDFGATLPRIDPAEIDGLPIAVTDLDDGVTVVLQRLLHAPDRAGGPVLPRGYSRTTLPGLW